MYFYHYNIRDSDSVEHAISGNFSGINQGPQFKEVLNVLSSKVLKVYVVDTDLGNVYSLFSGDCPNAHIRSVHRVPGHKKDYIAIGSDDGKFIILNFNCEENCFEEVYRHTFQEQSEILCPHTSPGSHLAIDPEARVLMIGSTEKTLMFYKLSDLNFALQTNLEKTIIFDMVGIHNKDGNPLFACLVAQYEDTKKEEYPASNANISELVDDNSTEQRSETCQQSMGHFSDYRQQTWKVSSRSSKHDQNESHSVLISPNVTASKKSKSEKPHKKVRFKSTAGRAISDIDRISKCQVGSGSDFYKHQGFQSMQDMPSTNVNHSQDDSDLMLIDSNVTTPKKSRKKPVPLQKLTFAETATVSNIDMASHSQANSNVLGINKDLSSEIMEELKKIKDSDLMLTDPSVMLKAKSQKKAVRDQKLTSAENATILDIDIPSNCQDDSVYHSQGNLDCLLIEPNVTAPKEFQWEALLDEKLTFLCEDNLFASDLKDMESANQTEESDSTNQCKTSDESLFQIISPETQESDISKLSKNKELIIKSPEQYLMSLHFYEYDVKSDSLYVESSFMKCHGNKLISVPPGKGHKGGVLICLPNSVVFLETESKEVKQAFLPQRKSNAFEEATKSIYIISSAMYYNEVEGLQILLIQSDQGDLFSVKIKKAKKRVKIKMLYLDTIPLASAMCILDGKVLYVATEHGTSLVYKIKRLGKRKKMKPLLKSKIKTFEARKLKCLEVTFINEGLTPLLKCIPFHSSNDLLHYFCACGQGPSSSLKSMARGVRVSEERVISKDLPVYSLPSAIWLVTCAKVDGTRCAYVIVSSKESTLALSVDTALEKTITTYNSGINISEPTIACAQVDINSFIQVYPSGFNFICSMAISKWTAECSCHTETVEERKKTEISCCAIHCNQIALSLTCNEFIYIEIVQSESGGMDFLTVREVCDAVPVCIEFVPHKPKAKFFIVCFENTLALFAVKSLAIKLIVKLSLLKEPNFVPVSLTVFCPEKKPYVYLNISSTNGFIQRITLDKKATMKNIFCQKIDSRAVKLVKIESREAILAVGSRTWISLNVEEKFQLVPVLCDKLDCVAGLCKMSTEDMNLKADLVAVSNKRVIFLSVKDLSTFIESDILQLEYTPRITVPSPNGKFVIVSECDFRPPYYKLHDVTPQKSYDLACDKGKHIRYQKNEFSRTFMYDRTGKDEKQRKTDFFLHLVNLKGKYIASDRLPHNHFATSMCLAEFSSKKNEHFLLVGVRYIMPALEDHEKYYVYAYKIDEYGKQFSKCTEMEVADVVTALCPFKGFVLMGIKETLNAITLQENEFKKYRLVVFEKEVMPCPIVEIYARGFRFVYTCEHLKVTYGYLSEKNEIIVYHVDRYLNNVVDVCFWDDHIMVAAEKNYITWVLLPALPNSDIEIKVQKCSAGSKELKTEQEQLDFKYLKFLPKSEIIVRHCVTSVVTSLHKTSLQKGGRKVLLYSTITGTIAIFVPFFNEKPPGIFRPLQHLLGLKGMMKDPADRENFFQMVKKDKNVLVIDGNYCDSFNTMPENEKQIVKKYLTMDPSMISGIMAEMKIRLYSND